MHDLNCVTNFYPTHCEFKDLELRRMIGNARECVGLYHLEDPNNPKKQTQVACSAPLPNSFHVSNNDSAIML